MYSYFFVLPIKNRRFFFNFAIFLKVISKSGNILLTKEFLIEYATVIAKSSKEDWLAFIGLKDSISDHEELFLKKLRSLLGFGNNN